MKLGGDKMKLPQCTGREVLRALMKAGFVKVSQRGSHVKMRKGNRTVPVPLHGREIPKGTLLKIIQQAGLTKEEFVELCKDP